jgi:hypothetical protein
MADTLFVICYLLNKSLINYVFLFTIEAKCIRCKQTKAGHEIKGGRIWGGGGGGILRRGKNGWGGGGGRRVLAVVTAGLHERIPVCTKYGTVHTIPSFSA